MKNTAVEKSAETAGASLLRFDGDWRTLMLVLACHGAILALLFGAGGMHPLVSAVILVPLLTLYSSLQHEVIHGHPFRVQWLNDLLALIPYTLYIPYYRFKDTHLAHHHDVNLCDPYDDPESWYQAPEEWNRRSNISQGVFDFNNTLVGRMMLGPAIGTFGLFKCDMKSLIAGDLLIGAKWLFHFVCLAIWLAVIGAFSVIPLWALLVSAYLGMSLLMVRTFLEHQAHEKERGRSVIIEDGGLFAVLFLNNSLHAVHHAYPGRPWYDLPALYRKNRAKFLEMNLGYSYASYRDIFRLFSFRKKEPVPYPLKRNREKR